MKDKMANSIVLLFLLVIGSLLFNSCEGSRSAPTQTIPGNPIVVAQTLPLILSGIVSDAANSNPIAGANVLLNKTDGTAITVLSTDNQGKYAYDVTNINLNQIVVHAVASSYGSSSITAKIDVSNYTTSVPPIFLAKVIGTSANIIALTGGQVSTNSTESVSGKPIGIVIPAGALSQNISISVSSVDCSNVSPLTTPNQFLTVVGTFEPSGTVFNSPVTITLPLSYVATPGSTLPLNLLNTSTLTWSSFGNATVDADGKSITFQTTHFSTYGASDAGSLNVTSNTSNDGSTFLLSAGSSQSYTYTPNVTFTTTNSNLSKAWVLDMLANNSLVSQYGLRVYQGNVMPITINTPTVVEPPIPSGYQKTLNGQVIYTNPNLPTENGTWTWQGVYQRVSITISGTITLGPQSENLTAVIKQYVKVSDQWTWVKAHDQGTIF
jgi:hypothetical protein